MEAATPLFAHTRVRVLGDRLIVDGLLIDDECAVRLAREHEEPSKFLTDAIEIGARVLDREHAGANAEFVRAEFERAAREIDSEFVERARRVAERLDAKVDEVFGPEHGHVTKALERHFGDESSVAVQHRVRLLVSEAAQKMREDLTRQFSSDSENNPLAGFQRASIAAMRQGADVQAQQLRAMTEKLTAMEVELTRLRAEREKAAAVAEADEAGTRKGRSYEEAVVEALESIAASRGDVCEGVGDLRGSVGRKGDVVVSIDACSGPSRGRIVFEAKDSQLSRKKALSDLDAALETRDADYAVFVVPAEDELPARTHPLREYNGDKMFVTFDPEDGSRLALEVAYGLARARVLMGRAESDALDVAALRAEVERAQGAMDDVRRIKSQLTGATTSIETARGILDTMAAGVRAHLQQIDALLATAEPEVQAELGSGASE